MATVIDIDNEPEPKQPLFLQDSDDDFPMEIPPEAEHDEWADGGASPSPPPAKRPAVPAMDPSLQEELDRDFSLGTPNLDIDQMRAQALARERMHEVAQENARKHAQIGSAFAATGGEKTQTKAQKKAADGELKKRKPIPKLNDERLLGNDGFPALLKEYKKFKPKGKGHEQEDLTRLLHMYQFWTHKMFPKMQFDDAVNRIEKVCHSRRMLISMSVWKDEAKNGPRKPGQKDAESDEDAAETEDGENARRSSPGRSSPTSSAPPATDDDWTVDEVLAEVARTEGRATSAAPPPSSSPEPEGFTDEDLFGDEPPAAPKLSGDDLDAEEMNMDWEDHDDTPVTFGGDSPPRLTKKATAQAPPPVPAPTATSTGLEDLDIDMDEFEDFDLDDDPAPSQPGSAARPTASSTQPPAGAAANPATKPASTAENDLDFPDVEEYTQEDLDALEEMMAEAEMYN